MRRNGRAGIQSLNEKGKEIMPPTILQRLADANDEVLTVEMLASILCVSKWAILKRIQRGQIKAHKEGNYWYILKSEYIENLRSK
jgi:hypothetical protein